METVPHLRPTALQQLRGFLSESGANLPPWTTSDEVMEGLAGLLHARRGDDAFFAKLAPFLEELRDNAARGQSGLAAPDAELLSQATVDSLVADLRRSLERAPSGAAPSLVRRVIGERAAPLLCLALLSTGLSACTQTNPPTAAGEPGTPPANPIRAAAPVGAEPASAEPGTPAPQPAKPVEGGTDALVEMFKEKSPQQAAQELEKILDAGAPPQPQKKNERPRPTIDPMSVTLYKGVILS